MKGKSHLIGSLALASVVVNTVGVDIAITPDMHLNVIAGIPGIMLGGLLPDIDHSGTPLGKRFKIVPTLCKHRGFTHSLLFTAIVAILSLALSCFYLLDNIALSSIIVSMLFMTITISMLRCYIKQIPKLSYAIAAVISLTPIVFNSSVYDVLIISSMSLMFLGILSHLICDMLTVQGIALFYPRDSRVSLLPFRTGSTAEKVIVTLMCVYISYTILIKGVA